MRQIGDTVQQPVRPYGSGDVAALYERYAAGIYAFVYRRTGDGMLADDITAQTFVRVLHAIGRYEDRGRPITAWLRRIAINEVMEHARRQPSVTTTEWALTEVPASADLGPEAISEQHDRDLWLHAALSPLVATLRADQRRAVVLRYWEERPLAEIAVALGRSEGATKALLHRARTLLRARFGGAHDPDMDHASGAIPYGAAPLALVAWRPSSGCRRVREGTVPTQSGESPGMSAMLTGVSRGVHGLLDTAPACTDRRG